MQTYKLKNKVYILEGFSMVGPLEGKGPLKDYLDYIKEHPDTPVV